MLLLLHILYMPRIETYLSVRFQGIDKLLVVETTAAVLVKHIEDCVQLSAVCREFYRQNHMSNN